MLPRFPGRGLQATNQAQLSAGKEKKIVPQNKPAPQPLYPISDRCSGPTSFPVPDLAWDGWQLDHKWELSPGQICLPRLAAGQGSGWGPPVSGTRPPISQNYRDSSGKGFYLKHSPPSSGKTLITENANENRLYTPRRRQVPTNQRESGPPRKVPELGMFPQRPSWQVSPGEVESTNCQKHPVVTRPHPHSSELALQIPHILPN